jgi:hypothetical protein
LILPDSILPNQRIVAPVEHTNDLNTIRENPRIHKVRASPKLAASDAS